MPFIVIWIAAITMFSTQRCWTADKSAQRNRMSASGSTREFIIGGVVSDYLAFRDFSKPQEPIRVTSPSFPMKLLKKNGFNMINVTLTTESVPDIWKRTHGAFQQRDWCCQEYGLRILKEASRAGLDLSVTFFLSHMPANAAGQFAPPVWKDYTVPQMAKALNAYTYKIVKYFRDNGLKVKFYELGNEINGGMVGFAPGMEGSRISIPPGVDMLHDLRFLKDKVWSVEVPLLKAAGEGVRKADPDAKIALHIAGLGITPDGAYPIAFYKTMVEEGVDFDYAGISYYEWSPDPNTPYVSMESLGTFSKAMAALGKKVLIGEFSYPWADPHYISSEKPVKGYPFTPEGQAEYVANFLRYCYSDANIAGALYFYPDYCANWGSPTPQQPVRCGLFQSNTIPMPAMKSFKTFVDGNR